MGVSKGEVGYDDVEKPYAQIEMRFNNLCTIGGKVVTIIFVIYYRYAEHYSFNFLVPMKLF